MKKLLGYIFIILITCFMIEFFSFSYLIISRKDGVSVGNKVTTLLDMHPWRYQRIGFGFYDPNIMQRYIPNQTTGIMTVNEYGFIANAKDGKAPTDFPFKAPNTYRVFLLGGSSMAGNAMRSSQSKTISAQLEEILNRESANGLHYEVLNYGVSGAWTYSEARRFVSEVVYLKPDLVISLDGWNDAIVASFEYAREAAEGGPIINWHQLSYLYFEYFNGVSPREKNLPPIFTYTYLLLDELEFFNSAIEEKRLSLYENHHWRKISDQLLRSVPDRAAALSVNLDTISSYCATNGIAYMGYLQPFAEYRRPATVRPVAEEEMLVKRHELLQRSNGALWGRERYRETIFPLYEAYRSKIDALSMKYRSYPHIRFFDASGLFSTTRDVVYLDQIHYNAEGNRIIAERFAQDMAEVVSRQSKP